MTNDDAIEILENHRKCYAHDFGWNKSVLSALAYVIALAKDNNVPTKWISVEDALPEKAGKYLVCGKWRNTQVEYWVCEFSIIGPVWGWINNVNNPCVHYWMPLPAPPEEVEK